MLLLLLSLAPAADLDTLLKRGPLVLITEKNGGFDTATGIVRVEAKVERVWEVLIDFASYKDFMPRCLRSEIREQRGNTMRVEYEVESPGVNTSYTVEYRLNEPKRELDVRWVDGDLEGSKWTWRLETHGDGTTLLHYTCSVRNFSAVIQSLDDEQQTLTVGINVGSVLAGTKAIKKRAEGR